MLKALVGFALAQRPVVLLGLLVFCALGAGAFLRLNIEAYPNPAPVILEITAQSAGLSAEEMERYYTVPLEVGLAATPGVTSIRSTSFYGLSFVRVTFHYGVDYYFAYTQAANALQQRVSLPNNVQATIQAASLVGEVLRYQLVGPPHFGLAQLRALQDWVVQRRFLTVPGVAQVVAWGGTTRAYEVEANLDRLQGYGITLPQLVAALGNANVNVGGRTLNLGEQSVNIRGVGLLRDVADIGRVVLSQSGGVPILVRDVADIHEGVLPRLGQAGRDDADDVVTGIVVMNRTERTNAVIARTRAAVERINRDGSLPAGVRLVPYYDRQGLIDVTTHTVLHNLLFGCLLVFLVQWLFLGDLRSAVIVGVNIPFALLFSVIVLVLCGESANLLSVGAVDFGIIVDSAVILVENVFRNLQLRPADQRRLAGGSDGNLPGVTFPRGWPLRLRVIFLSVLQVDRAVLFSSAITVAAFLPLFTMQGVEGQIFGPMARTYAYALGGALLATFTVTPVLASLLLPEQVAETETWLVVRLHRLYARVLRGALARRGVTVACGFLFLAGAAALIPRIGSEFLPALEEGNLWIRATLPTTISLEAGEPKVARMRAILLRHPEVLTVVSQHGRPDDGSDASGFFNAELFCPLKPFDQWPAGLDKARLVQQLQAEFTEAFPGVEFNFSQYIQDNIEEGLSGVKGANSLKIVGSDLVVLERLADQARRVLASVHGITDLAVFRVLGQPNLDITVDRARAARFGLNAGDINAVVQAAAGGATATMVLEGDRQFPLTVRLSAAGRNSVEAIRNLQVSWSPPGGGTAFVPLREVATITLDAGASYIYHESNERFIPVKFSVRGRDLGGAVSEAQVRVARSLVLPPGYHLVWAGEFEELQQARDRMAIALPLAFALILVLLYTLFNSLLDALLASLGIPFAIAGGLLALYCTGLDLSVSAGIGFVSLFGVAVMNGILVLTRFRQLRADGAGPVDAMQQAAEQRMRPMLMTALSACIGLLPAALSDGIGAQVQRPLATVVVGGMLIGPVLLLLVAPALQVMVAGWFAPAPAPAADPSRDAEGL